MGEGGGMGGMGKDEPDGHFGVHAPGRGFWGLADHCGVSGGEGERGVWVGVFGF